jgi:thioredoxin reductase (NADPH)
VLTLTLLSRAYCHLCDEMLAGLAPIARAHGASVVVVDVDAPAHVALEAQWGESVPALFAGSPEGGTLLCHYRLDAARVEAALRASEPAEAGRVGGKIPL